MIKQLVKGCENKIRLNPFYLTGKLYPLKGNDYNNPIEDRTATPQEIRYLNPVRISTIKKPIKKTKDTTTPVTYEDVFIMVSDNETIVAERLEFNYQNNTLKIIKRVPIRKYQETFEYEYELKDITSGAVYAA
jgi:hypothetical protein